MYTRFFSVFFIVQVATPYTTWWPRTVSLLELHGHLQRLPQRIPCTLRSNTSQVHTPTNHILHRIKIPPRWSPLHAIMYGHTITSYFIFDSHLGGHSSVYTHKIYRSGGCQFSRKKALRRCTVQRYEGVGGGQISRKKVLGAIQVLRNADGGGGCQISWEKALRRCNVQCY